MLNLRYGDVSTVMLTGKTTLKSIANELGLSISTVNFALNGKGRISEKTRNLVINKAREMEYEPNLFASKLSTKGILRIVVILPHRNMYFDAVASGIEAYFTEIEQYKVELVFKLCDGYDPDTQLKRLNDCYNDKTDGILLSPISTKPIEDAVKKLSEQGVPIINITNDLPNCNALCYVGQNGTLAGRLAGDLMCRWLKPGSKISILDIASTLAITQERVHSFKEVVQKNEKKFELSENYTFYETSCKKNSLTIEDYAKNMVLNEQPDAVYTNTMRGTVGLGRALASLETEKKILTFGYDANDEIEEMMKNDIIDVTLFQDPFAQGYISLLLMFRLLHTRKQINRRTYFTRTLVLTKSNIAEKDYLNDMFLL